MGIGSLLDVSRRALFAQSKTIQVIGSNIANVNTDGYSRREAELVFNRSQSGGEANTYGTGVEVNGVVRYVDQFLNESLLDRISERARAEIESELLNRAQAPFSLSSPEGTVGTKLGEFFSALSNLTLNPSDLALRDAVIVAGDGLAQSIRATYEVLGQTQREADSRAGEAVNEINRLSSTIADLNLQIKNSETSGQQALSLRDQRDLLMRDLSEIVSFQTVNVSDGTINIALANGFNLVTGSNSTTLEFVTNASFEPGAGYPAGLDGQDLGSVVFNYGTSSTRSDVNLTDIIASGNGSLSGLLNLRGLQSSTDVTRYDAVGSVVDLATRIELIARDLISSYSLEYKGPDESPVGSAAIHNASSGDLDGNQPGVYGLFAAAGLADGNANGFTDDLSSLSSYAATITWGITDPREIAAARDLNATEGALTFASGDASNIQALLARRELTRNYTFGHVSTSTTIEGLYQSTVARAGSLTNTAKQEARVSADREAQTKELQASISGVSLDEEFANLVSFQRAFQASARMIKTGDELLGEILAILQ